MDLHLTWTPVPGTNVSYTVEYRVYLSGGPFIVYSTSVTNNYVTIPGLAQNFYEARVKADCSADYIYDVGGKDPCQPVGFGNPASQVVEDTSTYQKVKLNFTNILPAGATVKVTNVNTNTVVSTVVVPPTPGNTVITLNKVAGQSIVYKVEVANNCPVITWQSVNNFTVTGPPPIVITRMDYTTDFGGANCGLVPCPSPQCHKPSSGIRLVFSEPLPQTTTFIFDFYLGQCSGGYVNGWYSDKADLNGPPQYLKMVVPAGVTTYGQSFFRDAGEFCAVHGVCIVSLSPASYPGGKKLDFPGAGPCLNIKPNASIYNTDTWHGCRYST